LLIFGYYGDTFIYIFLFFLNLSDDYEQDYAFKDVSRDANNPGKVYI